MTVDINLVVFGGRLTDNPSPLGDKSGCRFDVASNRSYKDKTGTKQEETTFMPVTCWGPLADTVMKNCRKGDPVIIEGRVEVRKFAGENGENRKFVNLVARDVRFINMRHNEEPTAEAPEESAPPAVSPDSAALLTQLLTGGKDNAEILSQILMKGKK